MAKIRKSFLFNDLGRVLVLLVILGNHGKSGQFEDRFLLDSDAEMCVLLQIVANITLVGVKSNRLLLCKAIFQLFDSILTRKMRKIGIERAEHLVAISRSVSLMRIY